MNYVTFSCASVLKRAFFSKWLYAPARASARISHVTSIGEKVQRILLLLYIG